jgi:anti-sigma factor RsiW
MHCIDRAELEQFLAGRLAPERMLAIDEHLGACADCKKLAVSLSARAQLGASIAGATDCPDYEELSAYIDESLDAERARAIRAHANLCELCATDVQRIRELRSHAALRDRVVVRPGMSRPARRSILSLSKGILSLSKGILSLSKGAKQAIAAVSLVGVVAAAVLLTNMGGPAGKSVTRLAVKPPTTVQTTQPSQTAQQPTPTPSAQPRTPTVAVNPAPAPAYTRVLRDGEYSVIRKDGALMLARHDGTPVRTALGARIASSIDEKLRTGRIKPVKPVEMAMATVNMRSDNAGYQPPPTAPRQIAPMGKVVLSARPTLKWSAVDLAESYRVRVYNKSFNLVAEQISRTNTLTLAKPLVRGQVYIWRVGVRFAGTDQWSESAAARFAVLSIDDYNTIQRVQTKLPGSHLALGAAYESVGLYDEAANEYRLLRRANPNSALAQKLLYGATQR